jgi:peptidoglycan/xylan/chitin deacetylase (PgdA/CDA1 family)
LADQDIIIGVYDNYNFAAPIEYTFSLILSIYGVVHRVMPYNQFRQGNSDPDRTLVISYGREYLDAGAGKQVHIYASDLFGEDYLELTSMPVTPLSRHQGLPIIYSGHGQFDDLVKRSENLVETNIDIIASSFFMLSRYAEVVQDTNEQHDRFPAKACITRQEYFQDRPIVNEYLELLWSWIHSLAPLLGRRPQWPESKGAVICLSHDVDYVHKYSLWPPLITMVQQKNPRLALKMASEYLGCLFHLKKDPFDTFDYMLDLEQRYGFSSSFYFMSGGVSELDGDYAITEPKVRRLIRKIEDRGCEVGLHGSYSSYNDEEIMASEKNRLDKVVDCKSYGCRQHYLRWKTPDTWRLQEAAGLMYDSSLAFAECAGFRSGLCLPFKPFDVLENRELDLWELPLIIMDQSLRDPNYQGLSPQEAYREVIRFIELVERYHGVFVLLWHNSSFDRSGGWAGWKEVYENIMEYVSQRNVWVTNGREIIEWWGEKRRLD